MRHRFSRINYILNSIGALLEALGFFVLLPIIPVIIYWGDRGDGLVTLFSFLFPSVISLLAGKILRLFFRSEDADMTGAMLVCGLSWLAVSFIGALPFVFSIGSNFLNAYFEAMSGFTATGISVYSNIEYMPRSIIFWRALTQWVGGIGILSFFLLIRTRGSGTHFIASAESHKIDSSRIVPGIAHTLKILWSIYAGLTIVAIAVLCFEGMSGFDSVCHSLTATATGGFSPYDSSIAHYRLSGHPNYIMIEYTIAVIMLLGGMNFLVLFRLLNFDIKALWDNIEIRTWWLLLSGFCSLIMLDHLYRNGILNQLMAGNFEFSELEKIFRYTIFQVIAIITTAGFKTRDIASDFFPAFSKQLFLIMMIIGGCVGSTSGGIKVLRISILWKLMKRELYKLRVSSRTVTPIVIDGKIVSSDESHRIAALFFTWIALLGIGGGITAFFSDLDSFKSFSGMFSALGNVGPCFISAKDMIGLGVVTKCTYIFGMLAGRLEIIPVFLLFSRKAWR